MGTLQNSYQFILELDKLKLVFRNTITAPNRQESTAEHSWSASMIVLVLMDELKKEFGDIDLLRAIKLTMIHDIVEIYAGDISAYDIDGRKEKEKKEIEALEELIKIHPEFGKELHALWHEFEKKESLESKIAKAADAICPLFQRVQAKQSLIPSNITLVHLEQIKKPHFHFSETYSALYERLKADLMANQLIQ